MQEESSLLTAGFATQYSEHTSEKAHDSTVMIKKTDGNFEPLDTERLTRTLSWAASEHESSIDKQRILQEIKRNIYKGVSNQEVAEALILSASSFIEQDPAYSKVASRLLFKKLFKEVTQHSVRDEAFEKLYLTSFTQSVKEGVQAGIYDKRLLEFDLDFLAVDILPIDKSRGFFSCRSRLFT